MDRATTHEAFATMLAPEGVGKLTSAEIDQLRFRAKQVAETMATPGWAFIAALVEQREQSILAKLLPKSVDEAVRSPEELWKTLGLVAGLRQARECGVTVQFKAEQAAASLAPHDQAEAA